MENLKGVYIGKNDIQIQSIRENFKNSSLEIFKTGSKSLVYFSRNKIDFILIELTAIDKSIRHFLGILRATAKVRDIVIILLVEKSNLSANKVYLSLGADDVFIIPEKEYILQNRILMLIDLKEKSAALKPKTENFKYRIPIIKRLFDITVAGTALIMLSPVFIITAIYIRRESKGPVFYASKRVGTGFRIFDFYKFRSMDMNADKQIHELKDLNQYASNNQGIKQTKQESQLAFPEEADQNLFVNDEGIVDEVSFIEEKKADTEVSFVKIKDDPRVTKVGRFIRNSSIDELPQLINVLKGDMSIVGNRPIPLYEAEVLTTDEWIERFIAPAGLTGLWQVEKRAKSTEMSPEERKSLDNEYARSYTFWKDLQIIFRTFRALFQSESV